MKQEKKYRIVGHTNGFIAQRDSLFKGKTTIVLREGLSLREAQDELLKFFNEDYDTCFSNWGLVRMNYPWDSVTRSDGTRRYDYDSRYYEIVEESEDDE